LKFSKLINNTTANPMDSPKTLMMGNKPRCVRLLHASFQKKISMTFDFKGFLTSLPGPLSTGEREMYTNCETSAPSPAERAGGEVK
jgi:hypothetical protein